MIDDVRIECEDDGFHLVLTGDFVDSIERYMQQRNVCDLALRLPQDAALRLLSAVRKDIGPWAAEMEDARRSYTPYDLADAYPPDDPKHPGYHDALAERSDLIRKRAKGE